MIGILAFAVGLGIFIVFLGLARTPQTNTAAMVQQRLQVYGSGGESRPMLPTITQPRISCDASRPTLAAPSSMFFFE